MQTKILQIIPIHIQQILMRPMKKDNKKDNKKEDQNQLKMTYFYSGSSKPPMERDSDDLLLEKFDKIGIYDGDKAPTYSRTEEKHKGLVFVEEKTIKTVSIGFLVLPYHLKQWSKIKQQFKILGSKPTIPAIEAFMKANMAANMEYFRSVQQVYDNFDNFREVVDERFVTRIVPYMISLFLKEDYGFIPMLKESQNNEIVLTRTTVFYIVALMFFGALPRQMTTGYKSFSNLMYRTVKQDNNQKLEKLKCMMSYFNQFMDLKEEEKLEKVLFQRIFQQRHTFENNIVSQMPLCNIQFTKQKIEDINFGVKVDFANKFIGGGVLRTGCVQEEILFLIHPELFASMPICHEMNDFQAMVFQGFRRFSNYTGYSRSFKHSKLYKKDTSKNNTIIAIDSFDYSRIESLHQFQYPYIRREIHKAVVGFSESYVSKNRKHIVTGKWGCGAFASDPHLKFLIQWVACSVAGATMTYSVWGGENTEEQQALEDMVELVKNFNLNIGSLIDVFQRFRKFVAGKNLQDNVGIFDYICDFYL